MILLSCIVIVFCTMPHHEPLMTFEGDDLPDNLQKLSGIHQPTMTIHCLASRPKNKMMETDARDTWGAAPTICSIFLITVQLYLEKTWTALIGGEHWVDVP